MALIDLANPTRFLSLSRPLVPWLWGLTGALLLAAFWLALQAPPDYQQGDTYKIMYLHVPAAWLSMACYGMMSVAALGTLVWRHPLADVAQKSAAPIGAALAFLTLATGVLWGRPTWGTWWIWDARLTSMLILFIMYLGLMTVWQAVEDPGRAARVVAVLTLVGSINIPIIKFSVDWWNSIHQGESIFKAGGPSIAGSMLWPLILSTFAATIMLAALLLMAMEAEILRRRVRSMRLAIAGTAA